MARFRPVRLLGTGALLASTAVVAVASPASATEVATEAQLRAAFADVGESAVVLTADITLIDCVAGDLTRPTTATAITLSGQFTLSQTCANERVIGSEASVGSLTVNDVTITGGAVTDATSATGGGISWLGDVTLNGATIIGNSATAPFGGLGGGLFASGVLAANQSTIADNTAGSNGDFGGLAGALAAGGGVIITESTLSGNVAQGGAQFGGSGGAIFGNSAVEITRSTISGNQATASGDGTGGGSGGAVSVNSALEVFNSTITGNVATGATSASGGLASGGDLTVAYSTVVGNSAASAANLQTLSNDATFAIDTLFGTVISDPLGGGTNCGTGSAPLSNGYNYSDDTSCGLAATGDQQAAADPQLGPLADNGGPTQTRLPTAGSPLLDVIIPGACQSGVAAGIAVDARAVARPQGTGCDVGAVEVEVLVQQPPTTPTTSPPTTATPMTPSSPSPTTTGAQGVANLGSTTPRFAG